VEGGGTDGTVELIRWIDEMGRSLGELAAPPSWLTTRMHVCLGWKPLMHRSTYIARPLRRIERLRQAL
jgi:hypothetical protein